MAAINSNGTGGGNWNVIASWAGGAVPGAGDTATILTGDTITVTANQAVDGVTIAAGGILDLDHFRPLKPGEKADDKPRPVKAVELDSSNAKAFPGKIPLEYRYTAGLAGTKFYRDLATGKLSGTYCRHCDSVHVPPAAFCEDGMVLLDPVKDARDLDAKKGVLLGFTIAFEDRAGEHLKKPSVVAQVGFEGAEGSVFGLLETDDIASLELGMEVSLKASKNVGPEHVVFEA